MELSTMVLEHGHAWHGRVVGDLGGREGRHHGAVVLGEFSHIVTSNEILSA